MTKTRSVADTRLRTPETLCTLEEGHNLKVARRRSRNADFVGRIGGVIWGVRLQDLGIDQLLESVRDAVVVADARSGRIVLWNAAATRMFGYSSSEALKHSWTVIVPERLKAQCEAGMARYRDTGHDSYIDSHAVLELPAVRKGGEEITIEIALSPIEAIRDLEGGNGRFVLAIVRNATEHKEVEKVIKEREGCFRSLVQNTSDIITLLEADGTVRYISPAVERVMSYKPEEQVGTNAFDPVHPDDRERVLGIFAEVLKRPGLHPPFEFRVTHKDGSWRYIEYVVNNLLDDPAVRGLVVTSRDVSERERTEKALIESERQFRQLFENSVDALFVHGEQGRFVDCNAEACRALGYSREELLELSVAHVVTHLISEEERREKKGETLWERAMQGEPGRIVGFDENELVRKDGSTFPVEVGVGAIEYGGQRMIFASARDISERKRAEDALKEGEAKYRTLVEQIPAVTYIEELDVGEPEWNMVYVSPQVVSLLGYSPEEYMSKPKIWEELLHPDDRERVLAEDARTERSGEPFRVQYRIFTRNGDVAWIRDEAILVRDEEGSPLFWQGVMYDITDQKRAEEEVRRLNEELEQRVRQRTAQLEAFNSELEAFSYSISHDLRAPLRAIDGFSQILLQDYGDKLDTEGKSYLRRVSAASRRMGQLIDDLLDLSHMTRGRMRRERVNLSTLAQAIVEEFRNTQPEHDVEVILEEGLVANGDESLLRAVLENLLGNAWKFTKNQPHPRIEFGLLKHGDTPTYYVRDNGIGFEMAYVDKLFGAFQRLHSVSEYEGTGIGLATVQRIIHRHGGRVWAKGEVGRGATFFFTL